MTVTIKRNRVTSIEDFEKAFEKKSNSNNGFKWPTRVGYKGRNFITVRFLTEFDQWVNYQQYYDPAARRFVVATEENEDSFAERGITPSTIHLASALDVETGEVIVIELKWTMVKEIKAIRDKKNAPITEFDIELEKRGEGKESTEYRASYEGRSDLDVTRYQIPGDFKSWQDYLWNVVERLAGTADDDDDDLDDDTDDDSTEEVKPTRKVALKRK